LKQLAERRTDIFGVGDEETAIGKKIGEEDKRKDDKVYLTEVAFACLS
jgi:splicing factor 3A subunit 1